MDKHCLGYLRSRVIELVFVMFLIKGTWSVCPGDPNRSTAYVAVDEANYDRNYSAITSQGKQPLGFQKAIWHFNQPDDTPCINLTNAGSRRLEIMFETFPTSRLCVKLTGGQVECSDPGTGRLFSCPKSTANTLYVEFTCDSQCAENDVQFWYRLVLGDTADKDPEDHWCDYRTREYPESLRQLPSDYPINTYTTKPGGTACRHSVSLSFMFVIILFILL
ncbi:hypothetical protein BsWGS_11135 [Bradybaena similaris]